MQKNNFFLFSLFLRPKVIMILRNFQTIMKKQIFQTKKENKFKEIQKFHIYGRVKQRKTKNYQVFISTNLIIDNFKLKREAQTSNQKKKLPQQSLKPKVQALRADLQLETIRLINCNLINEMESRLKPYKTKTIIEVNCVVLKSMEAN